MAVQVILRFRMVAMKPRFFVLLLCASLVPAVQARAKTILPDSCGDDGVKFDVKAEKEQPPPVPPADGKALIVFVGTVPYESSLARWPAIRYGGNGAWVGANKGNSYFTLTVDPGVVNVCVSAQGVMRGMAKDLVDMKTITAEPGKIYYLEARFGMIGGNQGGVVTFALAPLDENEGRYRVKAWKLATWKTNK
jgi:hypothetical protein